jgi:hypothetical protein
VRTVCCWQGQRLRACFVENSCDTCVEVLTEVHWSFIPDSTNVTNSTTCSSSLDTNALVNCDGDVPKVLGPL